MIMPGFAGGLRGQVPLPFPPAEQGVDLEHAGGDGVRYRHDRGRRVIAVRVRVCMVMVSAHAALMPG